MLAPFQRDKHPRFANQTELNLALIALAVLAILGARVHVLDTGVSAIADSGAEVSLPVDHTAPDIAGLVESSEDDAGALYIEGVLTFNEATREKGGDIEMVREGQTGERIGSWDFIGIVPLESGVFRFPIVTGGITREDYRSGGQYLFRTRTVDETGTPHYSVVVSLIPPTGLTVDTPVGFEAQWDEDAGRIALSWRDAESVEREHWLEVERATLADPLMWHSLGAVDAAADEWSDQSELPEGEYVYRTRTVVPYAGSSAKGKLYSEYSNIATVSVVHGE